MSKCGSGTSVTNVKLTFTCSLALSVDQKGGLSNAQGRCWCRISHSDRVNETQYPIATVNQIQYVSLTLSCPFVFDRKECRVTLRNDVGGGVEERDDAYMQVATCPIYCKQMFPRSIVRNASSDSLLKSGLIYAFARPNRSLSEYSRGLI